MKASELVKALEEGKTLKRGCGCSLKEDLDFALRKCVRSECSLTHPGYALANLCCEPTRWTVEPVEPVEPVKRKTVWCEVGPSINTEDWLEYRDYDKRLRCLDCLPRETRWTARVKFQSKVTGEEVILNNPSNLRAYEDMRTGDILHHCVHSDCELRLPVAVEFWKE